MSRAAKMLEVAKTGNLPVAAYNRLAVRAPRRLFRRPAPLAGNWSVRRLNALHAALPRMKDYLEVGLAAGRTFEHITLPHRVGVDPRPRFDLTKLPSGTEVYVMPSDEFFISNEAPFDLVFLDGLHEYEQTYRDVVNAMHVCPSGAVLIDDVVPSDEVSAMRDMDESLAERSRRGLPGNYWHGDVFKMVPCLAERHPELEMRTIIDGGNPQLLVWKPDPAKQTATVAHDILLTYASLSFADAFADGVPDSFAPTREGEALAAAVSALAGRYGS